MKEWGIDSKIARDDVGSEALKIPELHNKYYKILLNERLVLQKYQANLKRLKLDKQEFYLMGPTEETHAKGWRLPASGKILRSDLSAYMDADDDIISLSLKIGVQSEKVSFVESILQDLSRRNFLIKSFIDWTKIQNGII